MQRILKEIRDIPYIKKIKKIARDLNIEIYLVGGTLRDIFIKESKKKFDFDFVLNKAVLKFAHNFASLTGGKLIILDKVLRNVRVAVRKKDRVLNYDFSKFRGKDLPGDVKKRDFTINTLAIRIDDYPKIQLIDHLRALRDIERGILRCVSHEAFLDDPLRILRAFSLSALHNLKIERDTRILIKRYKDNIKKVASERITEELFKILSVKDSYKTFKFMDNLRVLDVIIPQIKTMRRLGRGGYHHLNVWPHSLETLQRLEILLKRRFADDKELRNYLNEVISSAHTRLQILKLACLFHDVGKPRAYKRKAKRTIFYGHEKIGEEMMGKIGTDLRLSSQEIQTLKKIVSFHMRPGFMMSYRKKPSKRAVYRFFRDTDPEGVSVLLLSLADIRSTRGPFCKQREKRYRERIIFKLLSDYFKKRKEKEPERLLDGWDIMNLLKIPPSPLVGKVLKYLQELQALGIIRTKREAIKEAKIFYDKEIKKV